MRILQLFMPNKWQAAGGYVCDRSVSGHLDFLPVGHGAPAFNPDRWSEGLTRPG